MAVIDEVLGFGGWCIETVLQVIGAICGFVAGLVWTVWGAIGLWVFPYFALSIALTYAVFRLIVERRRADLSWCLVAGECARNLSIIASLSAFIQRGAQGLSNPTALLETLPHAFVGAVIGLALGFAFQLLGEITAPNSDPATTLIGGGINDQT